MIENRLLILYIIQVVSIYNAIKMGWIVKKIDHATYEIYHKTDPRAFDMIDLNDFIANVTGLVV